MQSEDAGFPASSLSAHERYWVDTPARGCLMAKVIIFDVDGTLLDTERVYMDA